MTQRWMCILLAVFMLSAVACGGGGDVRVTRTVGATRPAGGGASNPTSTSSGPPTGETNELGQSVTGELTMSGALEGIFRWTPDLALDTCMLIGIELTMTDGAGTFIVVQTNNVDNTATVFGGALADSYSGPGAKLDVRGGRQIGEPIDITAAFDTTLKASSGSDSINVQGTLSFHCP